MKKMFVILGGKWFNRVNGNTYHAAKIIDTETKKIYYTRFQYGYGSQYLATACEYIRDNLNISDFDIIDAGETHGKKADIKNGNF